MKTAIKVTGMHCASCKVLIEDIAGDIPGVQAAEIDFRTGEGVIEHDESFDLNALKREVAGAGDYSIETTK
ncbi:MAG: Heavy metal-binding domain-containing protein [Candidatus Magasanikbacteria bacterium GW2011_GWA2_56_11]|uniref:Heavy metal-binding domain-containing protein n=1 Tax=Candidatus Magasanikbacteria bacterium GW2011_GWA2_56_11 TaxID=1619044 RepID=A0A0G1YI01_9BACT|nr:MAG: Heavy metal-binding domain-containing protein [Candidatus Magasanikbacteria bacterium GW2011_GWA2_56_11]